MIATIHVRMTMILQPDPHDLLKPFPSDLMTMWPISTKVNYPRNDTPDILEVRTAPRVAWPPEVPHLCTAIGGAR